MWPSEGYSGQEKMHVVSNNAQVGCENPRTPYGENTWISQEQNHLWKIFYPGEIYIQ